MNELSGAVIATSLVLIVVFLPVLVMPGSLGRLYQPLAVVISSTIVFSTINALSFTPVASAVLLGKSFGPAPKQVERLRGWLVASSQWLDGLQQPYRQLLEAALKRRRMVLILLTSGLLVTAIGILQRRHPQLKILRLDVELFSHILSDVHVVVVEQPLQVFFIILEHLDFQRMLLQLELRR